LQEQMEDLALKNMELAMQLAGSWEEIPEWIIIINDQYPYIVFIYLRQGF
jgi:hypothetical protein